MKREKYDRRRTRDRKLKEDGELDRRLRAAVPHAYKNVKASDTVMEAIQKELDAQTR